TLLFMDKDADFRVLAARVVVQFSPPGARPFEADGMKILVRDPSAAVRREALLALRTVDPAWAKRWIIELAKKYDGKDRFYLEAVGIAVGHHDRKRREIIRADFETPFPEWNPKVADLVWELQPPSVMPLLEKRLVDGKIRAADRARIVDILAISDDKDA